MTNPPAICGDKIKFWFRFFAGIIRGMDKANAVLDHFLDALGRCLTPDAAKSLVNFRADPTTQAHIDELAEKCNEGQLTETERQQYEAYVDAIDFIAILQDKAREVLEKVTAS